MQAIELVKARLKANSRCYNLIFMDVNMPIKGGAETALEIRRMCGDSAEQPFIVGVTGDSAEKAGTVSGMDRMSMISR